MKNVELECINPGEIKMIGRKYVVQIKGDESLKYASELPKYLQEVYNLSLPEYYSLVVFGNEDSKQNCLWCGKPTELRHKLYMGYKIYCNYSCKTSHSNTENNPTKSEEVRRKISEAQSKRLYELSAKGLNVFQDKEFIKKNAIRSSERMKSIVSKGEHIWQQDSEKLKLSERTRNRNLSLAKIGENNFQKASTNLNSLITRYKALGVENLHLYLIYWGDSKAKIGVTCNLQKRQNELRRDGALGSIHSVSFGNTIDILKLELKIKSKYCEGKGELFDFSSIKEVLRDIK